MLSNDEMLARLKALLEEKGELTRSIIDAAYSLPCHNVYMRRFGSLRKAYAAIGYVSSHLKYNDGRRAVTETLVEFRELLVDELVSSNHSVAFDRKTGHLTIDRSVTLTVAIARWQLGLERFPRWNVSRKLNRNCDLVVVVRMDEGNVSVLDYLIVPPARLPGISVPVGVQNPANVNAIFLGAVDEVISAIEKYRLFKERRTRGA